jgi:hypothetical protein
VSECLQDFFTICYSSHFTSQCSAIATPLTHSLTHSPIYSQTPSLSRIHTHSLTPLLTMANTYVVSSQKSTAVHHAVTCNFTAPEDTNVVIIKGSKIEVFGLFSDCLSLKVQTFVHGKITALLTYRPRSSKTDVLFILTENKSFCVLGYDSSVEVMITLAKGNVKDRVGHDVESGQRALLDPNQRMIGMVLYDGLLKVSVNVSVIKRVSSMELFKPSLCHK